jgi:hypothetical protein
MNAKSLLILSLAANLLLAVLLARKPASAAPAPAPARVDQTPSPGGSPAADPSPAAGDGPAPAGVIRTTNTLSRTFGWEAVESADYKQYIANLRSIGCPDETIRDIIVADVNKLYDAKKKAVRGESKPFEFWKPGNPFLAGMDTANMEAVNKLEKEKNDLLRALGIEPDVRSTAMSTMMNPFERMMDFLPDAKRSKVMELMMEYQTKMAKASEGGRPDPEDIGRVQKEMEAAIAKLLTPEENFDFQMRFSMTANVLRNQIGGFEPTQDEFVKIFNLRKEFDDQHSIFGRSSETPEERKQREADEKTLKETLKTALGESRFADYEMAQDWTFQQAHQAAKRSDLGPDVAKQAWQMRKDAEAEARKLRQNKDLKNEERQAALAAIRLESEQAIQKLYGDEGWQNYRRGNGASWLDNIFRETKSPAPQSAPVAVPTAN